MVKVGLMAYFLTPASEPKLTNPDEVHEAIRGLKVARVRVQMVLRRGPWIFFSSERYPLSSGFSTQFTRPITYQECESTDERSPYLNRRRIWHYPHPIGPLVCWTRLVNYLKTISAYTRVRKFEASFQTATSSPHVVRVWVAQGGLISPILVSLCVNDKPTPSHHVELALYANDMAISATFHSPTLLISYFESYFSHLQWWLPPTMVAATYNGGWLNGDSL